MSILLNISEGNTNFQAFVDAQSALDTYSPAWEKEAEMDYQPTKNFNELITVSAEMIMGSIIEKNADKPVRELPSFGNVAGTLGRMGDRFQMDNDKLERYYQLEARLTQRQGRLSESSRLTEVRKVSETLFETGFKLATFAPHVRLDHMWFQGLTTGIIKVDLANNPLGIPVELPTGIAVSILPATASAVWTDTEKSNPFADLKLTVQEGLAKKKIVTSFEMNSLTFSQLTASKSVQGAFTTNIGGKGSVKGGTLIGLDVVNEYLKISGMPPIVIKDNFVISGDVATNSFEDNHVVVKYNNVVAGKILTTDPLEAIDPHPNKQYATYKDNLVSMYRREEGRFIDYEMWGLPVFTGQKNISVLNVGKKTA